MRGEHQLIRWHTSRTSISRSRRRRNARRSERLADAATNTTVEQSRLDDRGALASDISDLRGTIQTCPAESPRPAN
jgi:hypothetical protein